MQVNYFIPLFFDDCSFWKLLVKMGIPYNYKWTLDFLVILYWDPEVRFAIKKWGHPREKGIPECPCFEPKRGKMQVNYFIALF